MKKPKLNIPSIVSGSILLGMTYLAFKGQSISGRKPSKYRYEVVLQSNHGHGWDDEISAESDSSGWITDPKERADWKENKRLYRENTRGSLRTIIRRTPR